MQTCGYGAKNLQNKMSFYSFAALVTKSKTCVEQDLYGTNPSQPHCSRMRLGQNAHNNLEVEENLCFDHCSLGHLKSKFLYKVKLLFHLVSG